MDEGKYPGKVEAEIHLQLKTESSVNQVIIKVSLRKSNNIFSFLVKRVRKNFINQVYDFREKNYNGLKEITKLSKYNNEQPFHKCHMQNVNKQDRTVIPLKFIYAKSHILKETTIYSAWPILPQFPIGPNRNAFNVVTFKKQITSML